MFDNIGGKIKTLAKATCVLGVIASVIGAIALWCANSRYNPTIALGFIVLLAGCIGSWIGSLFAYGFGELIETTQQNNDYLKEIALRGEGGREESVVERWNAAECEGAQAAVRTTSRRRKEWICSNCGCTNPSSATFCKACDQHRNVGSNSAVESGEKEASAY